MCKEVMFYKNIVYASSFIIVLLKLVCNHHNDIRTRDDLWCNSIDHFCDISNESGLSVLLLDRISTAWYFMLLSL